MLLLFCFAFGDVATLPRSLAASEAVGGCWIGLRIGTHLPSYGRGKGGREGEIFMGKIGIRREQTPESDIPQFKPKKKQKKKNTQMFLYKRVCLFGFVIHYCAKF